MERYLARRFSVNPIHDRRVDVVCAAPLAFFWAVVWIAGWGLLGPELIAQETNFKRFEKKSDLQKFTSKFDMLRLQTKNNQLAPLFNVEDQAARSRFQKLMSKIPGRSGGTSSSSGGGRWSVVSRATGMTVSAGFGMPLIMSQMGGPDLVDVKDAFWVNVAESQGDRNELLIKAKKDGSLFVEIENGRGSFLFRFVQQKSGEVWCLDLSSDCAFAGAASNFDQFVMKYPEYVRQRLSPIFKFVGIGEPPHRYHVEVQQQVLSLLRPQDPSRMKEFRALVETMNVGSYESRQEATRELGARFNQWRAEIKNSISDAELSTEIRSRLRKLYETNVKEEDRNFSEIAIQNKFHQDPRYLVWLLSVMGGDEGESADNRVLIVKALEAKTGQSIGNDLGKWQHWLGEQIGKEAPVDAPSVDLLATVSVLDALASDIGRMIRLKIVDGVLKLDRGFWREQYDGKSVKQLIADFEAYQDAHHLPRQWIQVGGQYPVVSIGYPQLIFDRMVEGLGMDPQAKQRLAAYRSYQQATRNRTFSGIGVDVSLEVHPVSNNRRIMRIEFGARRVAKVPEAEYFRFELREKKGPQRSMELRASEEGVVMINLGSAKEKSLLRLVQTAALNEKGLGCFLFDVRDTKVVMMAAKDFSELRSTHSDYFKEKFDPLLEKLGIKIVEE